MFHHCRLFVLALVPLLLIGCAAGDRVGRSSADDSATAAAVLEREQMWADAMRGHDYQALDDIMAAEFRLTFVEIPPFADGDSPALPRELWLENLRIMTFGPITMADQRVTMHGENVATVRMRMHLEDWEVAENRLPPLYDLTDVWVHRDNRWQVISRISEPLPPATAEPAGE